MVKTRYTFEGTLVLDGALHIGSGSSGRVGQHDVLTDATVIRDSQQRPYIPGSSLRGVLRTALGQYGPAVFDAAYHEGGRLIGTIREDDQIGSEIAANDTLTQSDERTTQRLLDSMLTSAERLFGTVHWASPLLIPDMYLRDNQPTSGEVRHGVGIDRDTGAARDNIKYDFEVVPRGARFAFWMRCDVPDRPDHYATEWPQMLAVLLRLLQEGELTVGGRAARGLGRAHLIDLKVYELAFTGRAVIDALLARDNPQQRYGIEQPDWVERRLEELQHAGA